MSIFSKSIKAKILAGFSLVLFLVLIISVSNSINLKKFTSDIHTIIDNKYAMVKYSDSLALNISQRVVKARGYVLYNRIEDKNEFNTLTEQAIEIEENLIKIYGEEQVKDAIAKTVRYTSFITDEVIPLYESGKIEETIALMKEKCDVYANDAIKTWESLADNANSDMQTVSAELLSDGKTMLYSVSIISIIAIVLGVFVSLYISRLIVPPVRKVVERLSEIANGDLMGNNLEIRSNDELGMLAKTTNDMQLSLQTLINSMKVAEDEISNSVITLTENSNRSAKASEDVSNASAWLLESSNISKKNATETTRAIEEMSIGIQRIAESSSCVSETATEVGNKATTGNKVIQKAVTQMNNINSAVKVTNQIVHDLGERSNEIGKILEVITSIAEQTNLLALNAAIEAARAGEHGKGFAVVAGEVRKLAEESKKSSNQISQLIYEIQTDTGKAVESMEKGMKEVNEGTEVVNKAGNEFREILDSIQTITSQIQEVSASAEQISASSQEVLASVEETTSNAIKSVSASENINSLTDETAKLITEINGQISNLNVVANDLKSSIEKFKI